MGKETFGATDLPEDMDGPVGEYPAGINNIVGSRIVPASGVKSDEGFLKVVQGSEFREFVADLLKKDIHSKPDLRRPHQILVFTSRNKAALASIALVATAAGTAYTLRKRHQHNSGGTSRTSR